MSSSTIAALATPPGRGGVAVIRVSGPDAFTIAERLTGWHIDANGDAVSRSPVDAVSHRVRTEPRIRLCQIREDVRHETRDASGDAAARRVRTEPCIRLCEIREGVRQETRDASGDAAARRVRTEPCIRLCEIRGDVRHETRDESGDAAARRVRTEPCIRLCQIREGVRHETRDESRGDVRHETRDASGDAAARRVRTEPCIRLCEIREGVRQETRDASEDARHETRDERVIDSALVLAFRAPHSYTGEDVVEFQCHGGTVTPSRVLAALFAAGATAARRGEFTERAFLSGKMDLSEAESVIELVDAKTARAADDALARQAGAKKATYRALYEKALALSAELEHALDVDEDELPPEFLPARAARAAALADEARRLAGSADAGRLLRDGALVVLAGAPNAGKSSLLNALCGEDRAIVSPTPGTTRDTIEAWIDLDGWPVRLVDTAGLRETGDAIEAEGVRRAEALLAKADVILALDCDIVSDDSGTHIAPSRRREICSRPRRRGKDSASIPTRSESDRVISLHAKCDLDTQGRGKDSASTGLPVSAKTGISLPVSAKTGFGLPELRAAIADLLALRAGAAAEDGATASERECAILLAAARQLVDAVSRSPVDAVSHRVRKGCDPSSSDAERLRVYGDAERLRVYGDAERLRVYDGDAASRRVCDDPVLLANAVRAAATTLGTLIGATYSSDLLDSLFSRFCVGK